MRPRRQLAIAALAAALLCFLAAPGAAGAKPRAGLAAGGSLLPGQALLAGSAKLAMHRSGDLALYYVPLRADSPLARRAKAPGPNCRTRRCRFLRPRRLWHTGTGNHPGARLTMRGDGAAVVRAGGKLLWSSRTQQRGAALRLRPSGELAVLAPAPAGASAVATASWSEAEAEVLWRTSTAVPTYVGDELGPGEELSAGEYLQSPNGQYELDMTPQGWLALWVRGAGPCPMFIAPSPDSGEETFPQPGASLAMEAGGLLALRSPQPGNPILWQMRNYANPHEGKQPTPVAGSRLLLENDGNLAVLSPAGETVWQTETERIRGPVLCPGETLWYGQVLASVYSAPGSEYQGSSFLEIATASRGRGSELNLVAADQHIGVTHIYKDKTGPSGAGMYLQMQNWGDLQLLLDGGDGVPNWESGTAFPGSFAAVRGFNLAIYAPLWNSEGVRKYYAIYEQPASEGEAVDKGIGQAAKIEMSAFPMG